VVTKNKVFWDLILCVVEIMAGVSKDSPYISTELNGVTSQKNTLFIVHRENLNRTLRLRNVTLFWSSPFHNASADNNVYVLVTS